MKILEFNNPPLFKPLHQNENILSNLNNLHRLDYMYSNSGILIWHILEDRIFISEGFCRLLGMSPAGIINLELLLMSGQGSELLSYLRNILNQVCNNDIDATSFKTRIPGLEKEIFGSAHLFDREDLAIADLVLICWKL